MRNKATPAVRADPGYEAVLADVVGLVAAARGVSARTVNAIMTTTYWSIGCRIVEQEQLGAARAGYFEELVGRLSRDLSERFGRGFGRRNLFQKVQTASALFIPESPAQGGRSFPLPWSHYVRLLSVRNPEARSCYEAEALRGGWSIRRSSPKSWRDKAAARGAMECPGSRETGTDGVAQRHYNRGNAQTPAADARAKVTSAVRTAHQCWCLPTRSHHLPPRTPPAFS